MTTPYPPSYTQGAAYAEQQAQQPAPYIPGGQYAVQQGQAPGQPPAQQTQPRRGQQQAAYNLAKHGPLRIDPNKAAKPITWEEFVFVGDDKYEVMRTDSVPPSIGLKFLAVARDRGEMIAVTELFDRVVRPAGLIDAMAALDGIEPDEINIVMTVVAEKLFAAGQAVGGKS